MKRTVWVTMVTFILIAFIGCMKIDKSKNINAVESKKENGINLRIVTTDKFLYCAVKDIVKDNHSVEFMFNSKEQIDKFEFTEDSIGNISKQDLFIYNGAGFEPWASEFIDKLSKNKVGVINVSRGIKLTSYTKEMKYKDTILKDNPYYYLNYDNYKIVLQNIKNSIEERDPKNRDFYEKNFSETLKNIEIGQETLKDNVEKLKDYTFVVDGDELDYFTKYLNLKVIKIPTALRDSTPDTIKTDKEKFENKLKESEKIIFLYDDSQKLTTNDEFIKKYNMKTINVISYKDDLSYNEILKFNAEALKY